MSGICGVWLFEGPSPDLAPVLAQLERRGPDGSRAWSDGSLALGHALLATTPEALVEQLPLTDSASGCTITADARLDNREELIAALGPAGETRTIGDGELILRAYLKWGDECPTHLLGDFAFAIWDPRERRLFCARDHMGMRQLAYHHRPGELFAFATDSAALVAHPAVPHQVNQGRIADYFDGLEGIDFSSTFFEQVVRLPPAHSLTVDASGQSLRRYWQLTPGPTLELDSERAYAEAFLTIFTDAVRCRLRSAGPVGSTVSGGLDSNSIAAVAGELLAAEGRGKLRTYSAIADHPAGCTESQTIQRATHNPTLAPTLVRPADLAQSAPSIVDLVRLSAEPFDTHMVIAHAVCAAARRGGVRIMLDGAGADVVLTPGNRVAGLLGQGRIADAVREARGEARFWGPTWPAGKILLSAGWVTVAPNWLRRLRRGIGWWRNDRRMRRGQSKVSSTFAEAVDLGRRRRLFRAHLATERPDDPAYRLRSICHPHLVVARERYDRVAAAHGVEARDPFMDIRLIRFALSLPADQLQADGWPKAILRRAMAGKLSDTIAWRRGKPHLGWVFTTALIDGWQADPAEIAQDACVIAMTGRRWRSAALARLDKVAWLELVNLTDWLGRYADDRALFPRCGEKDVDVQ